MSIHRPMTLLFALLALAALGAAPRTAEAQFGRRLKDAIKHTAENKAIQKTTETESKAIDGALSGGPNAGGGATAAAPATPAESTATAVLRPPGGSSAGGESSP